jgi:hypothetical protein
LSFSFSFKNISTKIYATVLLRVLCGCEMWSLIQGGVWAEDVCEGAMKNVFGRKGVEVPRDWRRLCNEELHDLTHQIFLGDQIKR